MFYEIYQWVTFMASLGFLGLTTGVIIGEVYKAIKYYKGKQAEEQEEHPIVQKFKSDEKAVILSNEEYERLKYPWCKYASTQDFQEYCVQSPCGIRVVEKEIAGEILCRIESDFAYYQPNDEFTKRFIFDRLKEIAIEYGVITNENINQTDKDDYEWQRIWRIVPRGIGRTNGRWIDRNTFFKKLLHRRIWRRIKITQNCCVLKKNSIYYLYS